MPADLSQALVPFGFTSLESEIYTFLLQESPATGYRIAQAINKAAANTYKAIESLQQKGAVLVEEGSNRMCRPVPSDELLARLTRDFEWRRAEAEMSLSRVNTPSEDDRIYAMRSRAQVIERARHMIGGAEREAVLIGGAATALELADGLERAASNGMKIVIGTDEPVTLAGIEVVQMNPGAGVRISDIRLVTDGIETLVALFTVGRGDDVVQALWSKSPYLSQVHHRGLVAELKLAGAKTVVAAEATPGFAKLGA